jgi:hypothetical protein
MIFAKVSRRRVCACKASFVFQFSNCLCNLARVRAARLSPPLPLERNTSADQRGPDESGFAR